MASARSIYRRTSTNSRSASTVASTHSMRSGPCWGSPEAPKRRHMPSSIQGIGGTLHVVGMGKNRIGMEKSNDNNLSQEDRNNFFVKISAINNIYFSFCRLIETFVNLH